MQVALSEIIQFLKMDIQAIYGNYNQIWIHYLKDPESVDEYSLDWVNPKRKDKQIVVEHSKARAIIADKTVLYSNALLRENKVLICIENPKLAIAKVGNHFFKNKIPVGIHSSAVINNEAFIGNDCFIGAGTIIGNSKIGCNAIIWHNVSIADNVIIGNNVTIKSGAVLGFEGFGFEKDENGALIKFPQLGQLIIEDNVEIGANTCIDRGSLANTIIGEGTKINNLCHIAHNVVIGKNVIITAQVNISGSTFIEDNVWIAPNASLRGHQKIGKGAVIGMGAVVTKNVPENETWVGNPAQKLEK